MGLGRALVGGLLVDELDGRGACLEQRLVARKIASDLVARRRGVRQIGFRLQDFGRLAGALQIGELILGLRQLASGLFAGGAIIRVVLIEQRRAFDDPVAARDMDLRDQALLRWPDLDEIGIRVALPLDVGRIVGAQQEPPAGEGRGAR